MKKSVVLSIVASAAGIVGTILGAVGGAVAKKEKQAWEEEQIDKSVAKYLSMNSPDNNIEV